MELLLLLQEMLLPSFHLTLLVLLVSETWKLDRTIPWDDEAQWSPCGLLSLSPELLSSRELESNSEKVWLPASSICIWNYYKWKIVYIVAWSNDFCKLGKYFWRISGMSKVFQSTTYEEERKLINLIIFKHDTTTKEFVVQGVPLAILLFQATIFGQK